MTLAEIKEHFRIEKYREDKKKSWYFQTFQVLAQEWYINTYV